MLPLFLFFVFSAGPNCTRLTQKKASRVSVSEVSAYTRACLRETYHTTADLMLILSMGALLGCGLTLSGSDQGLQ